MSEDDRGLILSALFGGEMKRTPESIAKASVRQFCKQFGIFIFPIIGGPLQPPGIADYLGIYQGRPLAIEVKAGKNKQSEAQKIFQSAWQAQGGIYILAYGPEDVARALNIPGLLW